MFGACLALELSKQGLHVDLYDRNLECVTQAGGRNEGKIHLGFVYGADVSHKTADLMFTGGMEFTPLLRRWIGNDLDKVPISSPFIYAIEHGSLLDEQTCEKHFLRLDKKSLDVSPSDYPGGLFPRVEKLSDKECRQLFNGEKIRAAYQTSERSIDVRMLARILQGAIKKSSKITFFPSCDVQEVSLRSDHIDITYQTFDQKKQKSYDIVINGLWDGRLALDQQVGFSDPSPWIYRIKHAIFLQTKNHLLVPSTTIIQGPYGDLVNFGKGNYYLSWYPTCMQGLAKNQPQPPNWNRNVSKTTAIEMTRDTISNLSSYIPLLKTLSETTIDHLSVLGGIIYAHGETDVGDPKSLLHERHQLNIKSNRNYYSVNPGKYSLCPFFAMETAKKICSTLCTTH